MEKSYQTTHWCMLSLQDYPASLVMVSWSDIFKIIPESARNWPVMLLALLHGSSAEDILIILDRSL